MKLHEIYRNSTRVAGAFDTGSGFAVYDLTQPATSAQEPGQFIAGFRKREMAIAYAMAETAQPRNEWLAAEMAGYAPGDKNQLITLIAGR